MDNIVFTRLLDAIEGEYDAFYSVSSPDSVIAIRDGKYIHINFITGEDQVIGKCREEAQPDRYLREDSDDFFLMYPRFGD